MVPDGGQPQKLVFNDALLKAFTDGKLAPEVESKVAAFVEKRPELLDNAVALSGAGFLEKLKAVQQRSMSSPGLVKAIAVAPSIMEPDCATAEKPVLGPNVPSDLASYPGYRIVKELGRGGMGVVYLAKNIQLDRLEVLKVLSERLLDHEGAKERFLREIRAVSKLNHANIVTSYSILPLENQLVFAMEHVHGMDLHQFIHKHTPLPIGLACSFARQIAAGLQHAHEKGLVHRDIKPSNAIVYKTDGQLQLKILDFGLAKATSEKNQSGLTQDGTMLGTPEYMSPEQTLNASKADIRADIYSLGCTLYCMLTGQPPFRGTHGEVLLAHAQRDAKSVSLLRPEVPVELSSIVARMMAKDASRRYQTPAEVFAALKPFLGPAKLSKSSGSTAAATNTVNDRGSPSRDTSVEEPAPDLSLTPDHSLASEPNPQQQIATLMADRRLGRSPQRNRRRAQTSWLRRNLMFVIPVVGLLLAAFVLLGTLVFRTPHGTLVVENLPADADILIDGERLDIAWNAGKDKAEIRVVPGKRQVEVRSKGVLVAGESVEIATNETKAIRVGVPVPTPPVEVESTSVAETTSVPSAGTTTNGPTESIVASPTSTIADSSVEVVTESDWTLLFNGSTLDGWRAGENADCWKVENSSIVGTGGPSHLFYDTPVPFQDFHFIAEVKASAVSNGGIYYHTRYQADGYPDGHEYAVNVSNDRDRNKSGSLYNLVRVEQLLAAANVWCTHEIIVVGDRIIHKLNDQVVVQYTEPTEAASPNRPFRKLSKGTFALQVLGGAGTVSYRNIRVRRLGTAESAVSVSTLEVDASSLTAPGVNVDGATPTVGGVESMPTVKVESKVQSLFDGRTLSGWSGLRGFWSVENGCIVGRTSANNPLSANTCLIWNGGDVGDFVLELEYVITGNGNSGIQYRSSLDNRAAYLVSGYQADIDASLKFAGANYDEKGRGMLASRGSRVTITSAGGMKNESFADADRLRSGIKQNTWNHVLIVAEGSRLSHYINDKLMSEVIDDSNVARRTGILGLQLHGGKPMEVRFRNIRLRQLDKVAASAP